MRTILGFLGLFLSFQMLIADNPPEAIAIIDKAIEASGGLEKLQKAKAQQFTGKGKMQMGDMALEYAAKYVTLAPNKFRFDLKMEFGGQKVELSVGTDGKKAWESGLGELRDMEKEKAEEFHHNVYVMNISRVYPLKDKEFKLTTLGESKSGEMTLVGIKVAHASHRDVSLFFDKKSGLLIKSSCRIHDEFQNKEVTQEITFSGYHDKDGLKIFDKMTIQRDGKDFLTEEFSDQKVLEKIDEKQFNKPGKED
jgi:hypothetical protein